MSSSSSMVMVPGAVSSSTNYYSSSGTTGYGMAFAVSIMVLVSAVMLASYVCVRIHGRRAAAVLRSSSSSSSIFSAASGTVELVEVDIDAALSDSSLNSSSASAVTSHIDETYMRPSTSFLNGYSAADLQLNGNNININAAPAPEESTANYSASGRDSRWAAVLMNMNMDIDMRSGLDEATLQSYPTFRYWRRSNGNGRRRNNNGNFYTSSEDEDEGCSCIICLAEYRDGEMIRVLPDCCHSFHATCVDAWLKVQASCPICRTSPLPTPVSTPLISDLHPAAI